MNSKPEAKTLITCVDPPQAPASEMCVSKNLSFQAFNKNFF